MLDTARIFREMGFVCVRKLVDTSDYYKFMNQLVKIGKGADDKQVIGSRGFYKEIIFEKLLENLLPAIEENTGLSLYKTYSYSRQYHLGEELKKHLDRHACEITVSLCLGNEDRPWPIWIRDREKNNHSYALEAGDALVFRGTELTHWREPNTFGNCGQTFLHYVDQNGLYAHHKDDTGNNNNY